MVINGNYLTTPSRVMIANRLPPDHWRRGSHFVDCFGDWLYSSCRFLDEKITTGNYSGRNRKRILPVRVSLSNANTLLIRANKWWTRRPLELNRIRCHMARLSWSTWLGRTVNVVHKRGWILDVKKRLKCILPWSWPLSEWLAQFDTREWPPSRKLSRTLKPNILDDSLETELRKESVGLEIGPVNMNFRYV